MHPPLQYLWENVVLPILAIAAASLIGVPATAATEATEVGDRTPGPSLSLPAAVTIGRGRWLRTNRAGTDGPFATLGPAPTPSAS